MGDVKDLTTDIFSLAQAVEVSTKASDGWARSFANLSQSSNTTWTVISRFLSGTGLWRLQNRIRAVGQSLELWFDKQKKVTESNNEHMKTVSELLKTYEDLKKETASLRTKEFAELMKTNEDIAITFKSLELAGIEAGKAQEMTIDRVKKAYESELKTMKRVKDKQGKILKKALDKEIEIKERASAVERVLDIRRLKEEIAAREAIAGYGATIGGQQGRRLGGAAAAKQAEKTTRMKEELTVSEEQQAQWNKANSFSSQFGKAFKDFAKPWKDFKVKYMKGFNLRKGMAKFTTGIGGKVGKVMGLALKFSLYFILFIVGAFVIFALIRKIMKNGEVMNTIIEAVKSIFDYVSIIMSGVFDIIGAFFGNKPLGERFAMLIGGLMKIFGGLFGIILEVMVLGIKLLLKLAWGIIKTLVVDPIMAIWKWGQEIVTSGPQRLKVAAIAILKEHILTPFTNIGNKILDTLGVSESTKEHISRSISPKRLLKNLKEWKKVGEETGNWNIPASLQGRETFAKGGISGGGMALVGERGPELVTLPRGARVHSNAESRRMGGNTFNINVNGRVGASDSELRDLAKKIGRMVNAEINRTTSASTNMRY